MLRHPLRRTFAPALQRASTGVSLLSPCCLRRHITSSPPPVISPPTLKANAITPKGYVHLRAQETIHVYEEETELCALQKEYDALPAAAQRLQSAERISRARQQLVSSRTQLLKRHPVHLADKIWKTIAENGLNALEDTQKKQHIIDWTCSATLPSARAEAILRAECRTRGQFANASRILRYLGLPRWTRLWRKRYRDEPEVIPSRAVIVGMAEVIVRDAIVLRSAPVLQDTAVQQQIFCDFHSRLKIAMQHEADKLEWLRQKTQLLADRPALPSSASAAAATPVDEEQVELILDDLLPADATLEQRADLRQQIIAAVQEPPPVTASAKVPRSTESRRSSNALFFERLLAPSSHATTAVIGTPVSAPTASPRSSLSTSQLLQYIPTPILAAVQKVTLAAFATERDLPQPLVRFILEQQDASIREEYNTTLTKQYKKAVEAGRSPEECVHSHMMQSNACYAVVGGVIDSLAHSLRTRQEVQKDDDFVQATFIAIKKTQRDTRLGSAMLLNGFLEEKAEPAPLISELVDAKLPVELLSPAYPACHEAVTASSPTALSTPLVVEETVMNDPLEESENGWHEESFSEESHDADVQSDTGNDNSSQDSSKPQVLSSHSRSGPSRRLHKKQERASNRFESRVQDFLTHRGVRFVQGQSVKEHLRGKAAPDLVLLDDVVFDVTYPQLDGPSARRRVPIRWLEMKSMYGATVQYSHPSGAGRSLPSPVLRGWLDQAERYRDLLGPGAIVFENQFALEWIQPMTSTAEGPEDITVVKERLPHGVVLLDAEQVFDRIRNKQTETEESTTE